MPTSLTLSSFSAFHSSSVNFLVSAFWGSSDATVAVASADMSSLLMKAIVGLGLLRTMGSRSKYSLGAAQLLEFGAARVVHADCLRLLVPYLIKIARYIT